MKHLISVTFMSVFLALTLAIQLPSQAKANIQLSDEQRKGFESCARIYGTFKAGNSLVNYGFPSRYVIDGIEADYGKLQAASDGTLSRLVCFYNIMTIHGSRQFYLFETDLSAKVSIGTQFGPPEQIRLVELNPRNEPTFCRNVLEKIRELDPTIYPAASTLAVNQIVFDENYNRPAKIARCLVHYRINSEESKLARVTDEGSLYVDYDIEIDQGNLYILRAQQVNSYR